MFILMLLVCLFFTARTVLILIGKLKEPVLRRMRVYGEETAYYPLAHLFFWVTATFLVLPAAIAPRYVTSALMLLQLLFLVLVRCFWNYPETAHRILNKLPILPRWYRDLKEYTSRYEQRRIAYLWLRLPLRLRALYNWHDDLFCQWADFVVMGTVMEEDNPAPQFQASQLEKSLYNL